MTEKAHVTRCGCIPHVPAHEHREGRVDRLGDPIVIHLDEFRGLCEESCVPAEARHVHTSSCYAGDCMNQLFGTSTQMPG